MMVKHVFWNILRKKIGMFFFSKNFVKIKNPLFREKIFKLFSNFSKTTQYFFLLVFGPHTRVRSTYFRKIFRKKIGNFSNKKISNFVFFFEKKYWSKKTSKTVKNYVTFQDDPKVRIRNDITFFRNTNQFILL